MNIKDTLWHFSTRVVDVLPNLGFHFANGRARSLHCYRWFALLGIMKVSRDSRSRTGRIYFKYQRKTKGYVDSRYTLGTHSRDISEYIITII